MSRLLTAEEASRFKDLVGFYAPHPDVLKAFQESNFAVIAGPAGAGKDTLRDALLKNYPDKYVPILSTTSRPPRNGEVDGETYHFREIEQIEQGIINQEFFQIALVHNQQVSCLHVDEVNKLASGQCGLSILVVDTEKEVREIKPNLKTIFLVPPSSEEFQRRLHEGRELKDDEIERRTAAAKQELQVALDNENYYCLLSETVPAVTNLAHAFLQAGAQNQSEDERARGVIKELLDVL